MTNEEIQEIVAKADDEYDRLKDRVHEQYDEIKRLKEEYVMLQNASDEVEEELQQRIDKAIEYIKVCKYNDMGIRYQRIEEILQGSDKE